MSKKQLIEILIVCFVMGLGLLVYDYVDTRVKFDGNIKRSAAGDGESTQELDLEFLDQKQSVKINISDQSLSKKEVDAAMKSAIKEIDETYLGKNKSANEVSDDLILKSSYQDGLISAYWKFDQYGLITNDGHLKMENIPKEGAVVNIIGELSYEEDTQLYSFSVFVCHKSLNTVEGQLEAIEEKVKEVDSSTRTKEELSLPNQVENMSLTWKKKMNFRGLQIIILGAVAVAAIVIGKKRDEKIQSQQIAAEKERDYPMIVSELSILMAAGMSFRKALERIVARYLAKKKDGIERAGYEDIVYTYRKICDGMGERAALEDLGRISESKEYRKLSMLLIQNMQKGSADLLNCLEKEERYAFEMRKQRAIQAGEEASTKLLIPMAGMLFIVIIILVVPALMQMRV